MRKNNKGFTLIELIAVVALLGILSVLVVPKIFSLVTDSRKNVYVQDAKRMIAQAQYVITSKNAEIQKPKNNHDKILLSLLYLGSNSFQDAPNGGEYLTSESFVVVEKDGEEFKYSAVLIEKYTKNDQTLYMGIQDVTEEQLSAKNAISHVQSIYDTKNIVTLDEMLVDDTYTNYMDADKYKDSVAIYHKKSKVEGTGIVSTSSPVVQAAFDSVKTLKPKLTVGVENFKDYEGQTVLLYFYESEEANNEIYKSTPINYVKLTSNTYTKEFDFSKKMDYGGTRHIYLEVIVDKGGSDLGENLSTKKHLIFSPTNDAPTISGFSISKKKDSTYSSSEVTVYASISDDITPNDELKICLVSTGQNEKEPDSCSNYQDYNTYFKNGSSFTYHFLDSSGNPYPLDGQSRKLSIFVKDANGKISHDTKSYTFSKNQKPQVVNFKIEHEKITLLSSNARKNGLDIYIKDIEVKDDYTNYDDLIFSVYEKDSSGKKTKVEECQGCKILNYHLSGELDGGTRKVYMTAKDDQGLVSEEFSLSSEKVYQDKPPTIDIFSINRLDVDACSGSEACSNSENGGYYQAELDLKVSDDLKSDDGLEVCISTKSDTCTTGTFVDYLDLDHTYRFNTESHTVEKGETIESIAKKYNTFPSYIMDDNNLNEDELTVGQTIYVPKKYPSSTSEETLYAIVREKEHKIFSSTKSATYKLYGNQSPKFLLKGFTVSPDTSKQSVSEEEDNEKDKEVIQTADIIVQMNSEVDFEEIKKSMAENEENKDQLEDYNPEYDWQYYIDDDFRTYNLSFCYYIGSPSSGKEPICKVVRSVSLGNDTQLDSQTDEGESTAEDFLVSQRFQLVDEKKNKLRATGDTIYTYLQVDDTYSNSKKTVKYPKDGYVKYKLYKDEVPNITSFDVKSIKENYNSYDATVIFTVDDPGDSYKICLTETGNCSDDDFIGNSEGEDYLGDNHLNEVQYTFKGGEDLIEDKNDPEKGRDYTKNLDRVLTLIVKDQYDNTKEAKVNYSLYKACSEMYNEDVFTFVWDAQDHYVGNHSDNDKEITPKSCLGMCYKNVESIENKRNPGYFNVSNSNIFGNYSRKIQFEDKFLPSYQTCQKDKTIQTFCDYKTCYDPKDQEESYYVSLSIEEPDLVWIYKNSGIYMEKTTTCSEGDSSCKPEVYHEPINFLCTGYFETYVSEVKNGVATLRKTPIRICPVVFKEDLADFYKYNADASSTYIRFSKEEFEANFGVKEES